MNTLESIKEWFGKAVPQPKIENQMMQIGCHFEEIKEMCHAMNLYCDDVVTQELRFKTNLLSYRRGIENMDSKEKAAYRYLMKTAKSPKQTATLSQI